MGINEIVVWKAFFGRWNFYGRFLFLLAFLSDQIVKKPTRIGQSVKESKPNTRDLKI